jgi:hypothetical protein
MRLVVELQRRVEKVDGAAEYSGTLDLLMELQRRVELRRSIVSSQVKCD